MKLTLQGGPHDGLVLDVAAWTEALCLTHEGKLHWYFYLGPPEIADQGHDGVLHHWQDHTLERALCALGGQPGAFFRNLAAARQRLSASLVSEDPS